MVDDSSSINNVIETSIDNEAEETRDKFVENKIEFINRYKRSSNTANSTIDDNSNVANKNIAILNAEIHKPDNIRISRAMIMGKLKELYPDFNSKRYARDLEDHVIYKNDESSFAGAISPYCVSVTMYPFLIDGIKGLGGLSASPKNLKSFCGIFCNMIFAVSSQFAGAVAVSEALMYFAYFCKKEWGDDFYLRANEVVGKSHDGKVKTILSEIQQYWQQIVYTINQPAAARGFQSAFVNFSYFDKPFFEGMFGEFYFPDGTRPDWESLKWTQMEFMKWFNAERLRTVLTFPVETVTLLYKDGKFLDEEMFNFVCDEYSRGHSFFTYNSDNADSLASCCRLRNEIQDNGFSYTLGAGGVSTGSKSVLTINLNRCIQYAVKNNMHYLAFLEDVIDMVHKVQIGYNENLKNLQEKGMLPLFDAGYINISRQYLTIGVNGLVEAAEFMGIEINDNPKYVEFVQSVLGLVEKYNKKYRTKDLMFNCEMIPAENVGVKHAKWDKEDGYIVPRDCYNSYFYRVEDDSLNIIDKFRLHGRKYIAHLTGGSALHANLESHLSKEQYRQLLRVASREGCNYFTFNIPNTVCNKCKHIDKRYLKVCPECGSDNVDYLTRVIGYMKRVSNFSAARQEEAKRRYYASEKQFVLDL